MIPATSILWCRCRLRLLLYKRYLNVLRMVTMLRATPMLPGSHYVYCSPYVLIKQIRMDMKSGPLHPSLKDLGFTGHFCNHQGTSSAAYVVRSASVGERRAALAAGYKPATPPINSAAVIPPITAIGGTSVAHPFMLA